MRRKTGLALDYAVGALGAVVGMTLGLYVRATRQKEKK